MSYVGDGVLGTVGFSAAFGGLSAVATGGDFWRGAAVGATVGLLNHASSLIKKLDWSKASHKQKIQAFLDAYKKALASCLDNGGPCYFDLRKFVKNFPKFGSEYLMDYLTINGEEMLVFLAPAPYSQMAKTSVNATRMDSDLGPFKTIVNGIRKIGMWANYKFSQYTDSYVKQPVPMAYLQVPLEYVKIFEQYIYNK
jgi:hypothetical protein